MANISISGSIDSSRKFWPFIADVNLILTVKCNYIKFIHFPMNLHYHFFNSSSYIDLLIIRVARIIGSVFGLTYTIKFE